LASPLAGRFDIGIRRWANKGPLCALAGFAPCRGTRKVLAGKSHKRPRTSQSEEIKRRTRVVRIFPNRKACLRLVSALAIEQPKEWLIGRRYPDMEELPVVCC
jgi:hypothetical protein